MQQLMVLPSDGNAEFTIDYGHALLTQRGGWILAEFVQGEEDEEETVAPTPADLREGEK